MDRSSMKIRANFFSPRLPPFPIWKLYALILRQEWHLVAHRIGRLDRYLVLRSGMQVEL
jgi:hypothetical protein